MAPILRHIKLFLRDSAIMLLIGMTITLIFSGTSIIKDWGLFKSSAFYTLILGMSLWRGIAVVSYFMGKHITHKYSPEKKLLIHFLSTLAYACIAIFLLNIFLYERLWGYNLFENVRLFTIISTIQLFIVIIITGVHYISDFLKSHKEAIKEKEALKREALHHNYEALKNQLSPHFLFNSLSVLSALVDYDKEKSKLFIERLSEVYRYVLEQNGEELIGLKSEMEFVKSYLYLHQIRHDERLKVEIDVVEDQSQVIPMSVQLLVENALKHNEASQKKPLSLNIRKTNKNTLEVRNTYQPKSNATGSGLGLELLKKRCRFLFDKDIEILQEAGWYIVRLPLENVGAKTETSTKD